MPEVRHGEERAVVAKQAAEGTAEAVEAAKTTNEPESRSTYQKRRLSRTACSNVDP